MLSARDRLLNDTGHSHTLQTTNEPSPARGTKPHQSLVRSKTVLVLGRVGAGFDGDPKTSSVSLLYLGIVSLSTTSRPFYGAFLAVGLPGDAEENKFCESSSSAGEVTLCMEPRSL
jgi:hypothetical protein